MAIFQNLTLLLHPNLHPFLFDLVAAGIMMVMLVMSYFFVWKLMAYVIDAAELSEPAWPGYPSQMRNGRKTNILPFSVVDEFRRQSAHLGKNGGNYAPMVTLEKKHLYLSRIEKPKQIKERKKNSMYNVRVLEVKQKKKRWLATSCDIELDGHPSSKRLKVDKDVSGTILCSRNIDEEKCGRRVEEVPDYMEVEPTYIEPEPDYMEVERMNNLDMLMDSVTRLMNSLSIDEHSACRNLHSHMSIDDLENLTMDLNLVEQLNQINIQMDMSVDDIQNLMTGLSLMEHSDHTIDMCIEDITNLMKVLSLTAIRRECFYIET